MAINSQPGAASAWGLLRIRGGEALKFLQGQLSNDMALLAADRLLLAGLHNPQGRVLALLRLAAPEPGQVIALLPTDLAAATTRPEARALDIAAGIPQVYAATSGGFVAQMLNLDCIGAISFSKGCYTGQEIIARAHYRGRMKRRLQRFETAAAAALAPGQAVSLSDGRAAQIVDAVVRPDGCTEFLAVTPLSADALAGSSAEGDGRHPSAALACTALPLPYMLPQ
jgi:tRNA-modifying protein YgfZ